MNFAEFIVNNWYIILAVMAVGAALGIAIFVFLKMPTSEQIDKACEWLLWAVTEAERELGSGTGQLKLRLVYDRFIVRFPWLAKVISFSVFCGWVDDALTIMRDLLAKNKAVQDYVDGGTE